MRILTIDVGTGTQDILLYDSKTELENCVKMVMPSPTAVVARQIRAATELGTPLLLDGVTMGGGPSHWAARDHALAGHAVYATPDAARTFDDDLDGVRSMGIVVVSEDEAATMQGVQRVTLRDLWIDAVQTSLRAFGADDQFDALAVAVFDHGNAPPGYSDRTFRFEYLAEQVRQSADLTVFSFMREDIPASLTRLKAVASSIDSVHPLLVMDTAPLPCSARSKTRPSRRGAPQSWRTSATSTVWRSNWSRAASLASSSTTPVSCPKASLRRSWTN